MDLSIVIVSWNTRELLEACLRSVYAETQGLAFEVFVVDNGSADGSPKMVEQAFSQVQLIRNAANVGFARANNQALRLSQGQYVLLLNPDTVILDNALTKMVQFMKEHPNVGALGCKILTAEGDIDPKCTSIFPTLLTDFSEETRLSTKFPRNRLFGSYFMTYWNHNDNRQVGRLSGACLMVRREAMQQVGLLDEDFYMYGEDIDWCYRLWKDGWEVWYYSGAVIIHIGSQSSKLAREEMSVERFRSRYTFFRKHHGLFYAGAFRVLICLITAAKLLIFWEKSLTSNDKEKARWYREKVKLHKHVLEWVFTD